MGSSNAVAHIYVDGTYTPNRGQGYAFVVFNASKSAILHQEAKPFYNEEYKLGTNCSAELIAVIKAVQWAEKNKFKFINIYHDYSGIKTLAYHKIPGHRYELFDYYKIFIKKRMQYADSSRPRVFLRKVRSHKGDFGNEIADCLARSVTLRISNSWFSLLTKWYSIASHSLFGFKFQDRLIDWRLSRS